MRLTISRLWQVLAISTLVIVSSCQHYDSDYKVTDDDDEDYRSGYYDEPGREDYSKYYLQDKKPTPIALNIQNAETKQNENGFVQPLDFAGLFGPAHFGFGAASSPFTAQATVDHPFGAQASTSVINQTGFVPPHYYRSVFDAASASSEAGFKPQDFLSLDQGSTNKQLFSSSPYYNKPGPSYVSHKVPSIQNYEEVSPLKEYHENIQNSSPESSEQRSGYVAPSYATSSYESDQDFIPQQANRPSEPHLGKTQYPLPLTLNTLSAKPSYYPNEDLKSNYRSAPVSYQKYSFQPSNILSTSSPHVPSYPSKLESTAASILSELKSEANREDTEIVGRKICKRIEKDISAEDISNGRFRRDAMTCFLCTEPKTGETYEQCSYKSDPNNKQYFAGSAEKYSTGNAPATSFRYKRYTKKSDQNEESEYDFSELKNQKYKSRPEEFEGERSHYRAPDFSSFEKEENKKYRFGPEYFSFDPSADEEKSFSEIQSEKLKSSDKCKKVHKDSMTCMVCENPKTGGSYEQCSYTSEPNEKKYAYVKESKFNSNDEPDEKTVEGTESKPTVSHSGRQQNRKTKTVNKDGDVCEEIKKKTATCKVCKNPKTGAKSEQCSYRSAPNEKQYAYVNERKFNGKPSDEREKQASEERPVTRSRGNRRFSNVNDKDYEDTPKNTYRKRYSEEDDDVKEKQQDEVKYSEQSFDIPEHFVEETKERESQKRYDSGHGLDSELYGSPDTRNNKKEENVKEDFGYNPGKYEDYFSKLFPEYAEIKEDEREHGEASENKEHGFKTPTKFFAEETKKDVEEVLAEFAKKDRSDCKKVTKGKLTCYRCADKKGQENEECMYVTESKPEKKHMAYHQMQKYSSDPNPEGSESRQETSESKINSTPHTTTSAPFTTTTESLKRKKFFKKVTSSEISDDEIYENFKESKKLKPKKKKSAKDTSTESRTATLPLTLPTVYSTKRPNFEQKTSSSGTHYVYEKAPVKRKIDDQKYSVDNEKVPESADIKIEGSDGAFASELKPVYSKRFGVTLPRFMLDRSEHEEAFDEAVSSG